MNDESIEQKIFKLYTSGLSVFELKDLGYSKRQITDALAGRRRSMSESQRIAKSKKPTIMTDKIKDKISKAMKLAAEEGRLKGWSFINNDKNRRSYPEQFFYKVFENNGLFKRFTVIEKLSFGKYFLDFAIVDLKLDIEIDGQKHFRSEKAIQHDKIRDQYLIEHGWKVYRIAWIQCCKNKIDEIKKLLDYINNVKNETSHFYNINEIIIKKKHGSRKDYENKVKANYNERQKPLIDLILNSNINFSKFGWVKQVSKIINLPHQKVNKWMKRFMLSFYNEKCFKKRQSIGM